MKFNYKFEKLIFLTFVLSLIAVFSEEYILQDIITIDITKDLNRYLYNDNASGGSTVTNDLSATDKFDWQCELKKGNIDYPFCGLEFDLGHGLVHGINLSNYSGIKLWLDYQGSADTIRLSLKNHNPLYSKANDSGTNKYNDLDVRKEHLKDGLYINLSNFSVPTWWILQQKLSPHLSAPEFNNIVLFDIQTGSDVTSGVHKFSLKKIEFIGQWLPTESWYLCILFLWLLIVFIMLAAHFTSLMKEIKLSQKREQELLMLNGLLDEHSKVLETQANTDQLTGVFNRQGVEDAIARALNEWQEKQKPLSIIMFDIDKFKSINDTYGHGVGDSVLSSLAALVQKHIRVTDRFARWGGEEFVVVCRNTAQDMAIQTAEKLRKKIEEEAFIENATVTASFGVANIRANGSIQELFKDADDALYKAKNNGRNRVEI